MTEKRKSKRAEFIEKAVPYYLLVLHDFIVDETNDEGRAYSKQDIESNTVDVQLRALPVFQVAVQICADAGVIEVISDDFAPTTYVPVPNPAALQELRNRYPAFKRRDAQSSREHWLKEAIREIGRQWAASPALLTDDPQQDLWQPIPLDRSEPSVQRVQKALENVIEAVRADNGYAASNPEERRYVLDQLSGITKRIKEDAEISWMYVKLCALDPLGVLIKRFGEAATGFLAAEAKDLVLKWVREKGGDFVRSLFG